MTGEMGVNMSQFNDKNSISLIWCIDDVRYALDGMKDREWFINKHGHTVKLTDEDCMDILGDVKSNHDATIGVSWETLEYHIDELLEERTLT